MNIRALVAGISTAAAVTTGGLALTSTIADAQGSPHAAKAHRPHPPKAHRLRLVAVTTRTIRFTRAYTAEASSDYDRSGRLIGLDVLHFTKNPSGREVTCDGAFDLDDGVIYTTFTTSTRSARATGAVTGGTGAYVHAAGTITVATKSSAKTSVTIAYTSK